MILSVASLARTFRSQFLDPFVTGDTSSVNKYPSGYVFVSISGMYNACVNGWAHNPLGTAANPDTPDGIQTDPLFHLRNPMEMYFNQSTVPIQASWCLVSAGPDRSLTDYDKTGNCCNIMWSGHGPDGWWGYFDQEGDPTGGRSDTYDGTNGTRSQGNIWRFSSGASLND